MGDLAELPLHYRPFAFAILFCNASHDSADVEKYLVWYCQSFEPLFLRASSKGWGRGAFGELGIPYLIESFLQPYDEPRIVSRIK